MIKKNFYIQSAIYNAMNHGMDTIRLLKDIDVNHYECDSHIQKLAELAHHPENFEKIYYNGYTGNKIHFFLTALQLDIDPELMLTTMGSLADDPIIHPYLVSYLVKNEALDEFFNALDISHQQLNFLSVPLVLGLLQQYPIDLLSPYLNIMYRPTLFECAIQNNPGLGKNIYSGDRVRDLLTSLVFGDTVDRFLLGYYHNDSLWLYAAKADEEDYQKVLKEHPLFSLFSFASNAETITSYMKLTQTISPLAEELPLHVS